MYTFSAHFTSGAIKMTRYLPLIHCLVAQWFPGFFFPTQNDCLLRWAIGVRRFVAWLRIPPRKGRFFRWIGGVLGRDFFSILYIMINIKQPCELIETLHKQVQYGSFGRFPLPNPNIPKHHFRPLNLTKWIKTYSCHGSKNPQMCLYIYIFVFSKNLHISTCQQTIL